MSNKESMRGSHHKKSWSMKMYDQCRYNYKIVSSYIERCLRKSIGKNFDSVKKHIYEKMVHHNIARHDDNIVDGLIYNYIGESEFYKYILDSQNRIQLNKEYIKRHNRWSEDKKSGKLTIIDKDKEVSYRIKDGITDNEINKLKDMLINNGSYNKEVFNHIFNGGILSQKKYMEFIYSIKWDGIIKRRWSCDYIYDTRKYAESLFTIYDDNVVYIFDNVNSSEYIRYKKEISDRKRKERREYKKAKDEYNEDLLFCL
jgi:hypothetical protein